jgi:hypothetical protein
VGLAADKGKNLTQTVYIEAASGPAGRWWEYETAACKSNEVFNGSSAQQLNYEYSTLTEGWQNNGYGIFIDGTFGAIVLPDAVDKFVLPSNSTYYAKSMHFEFPSQRLIGTQPAVGEFHITHQRPDGKATAHLHQDGIAVVVIPLRLPLEGAAPSSTEVWFETMGLNSLPAQGATKPLTENFSLADVFGAQLNGTFNELDCHEPKDPKKPRWLLMTEPATITGKVVQAFKDMFPYETTNADDYTRTYEVEGTTETHNYDQLGREHLVGISQTTDPPTGTAGPTVVVEGMKIVHDPEYLSGCGEFMPFGEWYIPEDA